jgi:hypothetical protein
MLSGDCLLCRGDTDGEARTDATESEINTIVDLENIVEEEMGNARGLNRSWAGTKVVPHPYIRFDGLGYML